MQSRLLQALCCAMLFSYSSFAQNTFPATGSVGIGTTAPGATSLMEVASTTKGVLLPRMTTAQRNAIASPATGLLIYQTDGVTGFYYYSAGWKAVTPLTTAASTTLSNLSTITAINQHLQPSATNVRDLVRGPKAWKDLYLTGTLFLDSIAYISNKGTDNTFIGTSTGSVLTTGAGNTATGFTALMSVTTGGANTASGAYTLGKTTTGSRNAAFGLKALYNNTTGNNNTAIGYYAMINNTTASANTAVGYFALTNNGGSGNTATGSEALFSNTSGSNNTASGNGAMRANTTGAYNAALGHQSLYANTTGAHNTASGAWSLFKNTVGNYNTAVGHGSLYSNESGQSNTGVGYLTLSNNYTGEGNTATGIQALENNTIGESNTASGRLSLWSNVSGVNNTAVGAYALWDKESSSYNTALGAWTAVSGNNATAIGYEATTTASNQVRIGNSSVTSIGGQVGWTVLSDGRFKRDIKEEVPGLSFISKLRPVTYHLDVDAIDTRLAEGRSVRKDSTGVMRKKAPSPEALKAKEEKAKVVYTGFIAQEVEETASKLHYDFSGVDKPKKEGDFYGLRYSDFVVPLVKAVQELSEENKELKKENELMLERFNKLEAMVISMVTPSGNAASVDLSSAYLEANVPNPVKGSTIIRYYLPANAGGAKLVITDMRGMVVKNTTLNTSGKGQVTVSSNALAVGTYTYSLWVGGRMVDSKQMIIGK